MFDRGVNRFPGERVFVALVERTSSTSQSSSTSSAATSADAASGSAMVVKIGIDMPVSGADASTGIPTRNGAVKAIEEANSRRPAVTFAAYDLDDAVQGAHDPAQGAQNIKSFVSDSAVLAIVGPFNSNVAKAEIPITNDAGLAQISPSNTSTGLTKARCEDVADLASRSDRVLPRLHDRR
jgi:branched-chain amino acid transport system substrate-binding protein